MWIPWEKGTKQLTVFKLLPVLFPSCRKAHMHKGETLFLPKNLSLGFPIESIWALPTGRPSQIILTRTPHLLKLRKAENLDTAVHKKQNLKPDYVSSAQSPCAPWAEYDLRATHVNPLQPGATERGEWRASAEMLTSERGSTLGWFLVQKPNQSWVQNTSWPWQRGWCTQRLREEQSRPIQLHIACLRPQHMTLLHISLPRYHCALPAPSQISVIYQQLQLWSAADVRRSVRTDIFPLILETNGNDFPSRRLHMDLPIS